MGLRGVGEPLGRLAAACTLARRGPSYAATCFPTVDVGRAERHQGPERRGLRRSAAKTATHLRQAPQRVVRRPQACTGRARPTPPRRRMLTKSGRATASESVIAPILRLRQQNTGLPHLTSTRRVADHDERLRQHPRSPGPPQRPQRPHRRSGPAPRAAPDEEGRALLDPAESGERSVTRTPAGSQAPRPCARGRHRPG